MLAHALHCGQNEEVSGGMRRVDLNADVGESTGAVRHGDDEGVMPFITSANIACGFHAGDPGVMRATVALARAHGVAVGAHPGFQDLAGFGRRELAVSPQEAEDLVAYQVGALAAIAAGQGVRLTHVKPHGALYNMAARDRGMASAIARAVAAIDKRLLMFAPPFSALTDAARDLGLTVVSEAFVDRAYQHDGTLVARDKPGAVLHDLDAASARAVRLATAGTVTAIDGTMLTLRPGTLCIHSDPEGADRLAARVRADLEAAGVTVRPPAAA